ncbi:MAG: hypothetical protein NXH82_02990 [Rhodobacteraceae bacterium]|nr:hypothetical protein [Paracoccaceae bacterium]
MPILRINARGTAAVPHSGSRPLPDVLARAADGAGPVIVMIHGLKYAPGHPRHCPHHSLFALNSEASTAAAAPGWPRQLGFGTGHPDEGLALTFGWAARRPIRAAQRAAADAGMALAEVVHGLSRHAPHRPVHVIAHSLGVDVALSALPHLDAGAFGRILSLAGACFQAPAHAALQTPAGATAELINITSRENDPFDFLFERFATAPRGAGRAIGQGIAAPNAVTLQLDCAHTLAHLDRLGAPIEDPDRRICHWSAYTRRGTLRFYNDLMRRPDTLPLAALRRGLPQSPAPRWSRLLAPPAIALPLPFAQNAS